MGESTEVQPQLNTGEGINVLIFFFFSAIRSRLAAVDIDHILNVIFILLFSCFFVRFDFVLECVRKREFELVQRDRQ